MNFELGIKDFEYTELKTVERIQYSALSNSDFGENESKTSNQANQYQL
jgi:isopentenyldiphosphate isomerase